MSDAIDIKATTLWCDVKSRATMYLELSKPRISLLVLISTAVGFYLPLPPSSASRLTLSLLLHTLLGTFLVAAGANSLNQYLEADFDLLMRRTASRPIPSGRLSRSGGLVFGAVVSTLGLLELGTQVNLLSAAVAGVTLLSYVMLYTPLKRKTAMCVFVGALAGALPPLIGWTAATASLGVGAWMLFGILYFWQLPHFAAIAWQFRDDYARGGFPMLSVLDQSGRRTQLHLITHSVGLLAASLLPALGGLAGPWYALSAMVLGAAFLASGVLFLRQRTTRAARQHVLASVIYLPLLLAMMLLDKAPVGV